MSSRNVADNTPPVVVPPPSPTVSVAPGITSVYLTVVWVFVTHGLVNAALLSGYNKNLRCLYWDTLHAPCQEHASAHHHAWYLNWWSFGQWHVCLLLGALAKGASGLLAEQRLAHLVCAIITSNLSTGIFMLDSLNQPLALVQVLIYLGLLLTCALHVSVTPLERPVWTMGQFQSASYDFRKKISLSTLVVGAMCILSCFQLVEMTFGQGRESYADYDETRNDWVVQSISHAGVTQMLWVSLILAWSTALATTKQHHDLLLAHGAVLFVALIMLTGSQGYAMKPEAAKTGCVANFFIMVMALLGAFY